MPAERRILFWMCVLIAVNQLGFGAMIPTMALYAQSFGVAASAIGIAISIYGLSRMVGAVPAGQWSDRYGRRNVLALGGLVSGLGNLWCAWATSYPEFIVARFVAGFGAGLITTGGQIVLADISTIEQRGRMVSIYQGTFIFAVGVGPYPGGLLAEHFGLAAPFTVCGIASLLAMVVAWFAVGETRGFQIKGKPKAAAPSALPFLSQMRVLLRHRGFCLVSLLSLFNAVVRTGGLFAIVPILMTTRLGLSVSSIGFAMMIGSIAGLIASYPAGWLTDRFGRKTVIVPATLLAAGSMLLFCVASGYAWFFAACIVWSVSIAIGSAAPATYAADVAPPGMNAAAMSTYRMTADLGYVIGPLALGLIADISGPVTALVVSAAALAVIGVVFAIVAPETYRSSGVR